MPQKITQPFPLEKWSVPYYNEHYIWSCEGDSRISDAELDERYTNTERDHQVASARPKQLPAEVTVL